MQWIISIYPQWICDMDMISDMHIPQWISDMDMLSDIPHPTVDI